MDKNTNQQNIYIKAEPFGCVLWATKHNFERSLQQLVEGGLHASFDEVTYLFKEHHRLFN